MKEQGNIDIYEDWYLQYEQLRPFLLDVPRMKEDETGLEPGNQAPAPNLEAEILVIGAGLSSLSEDISSLGGFECITNLDFSSTVQDYIEKKYSGDKGLKFDKMDFLNVDICNIEETIEEKQLNDGFDVIIDKAVLDCVACNDDSTMM